jgi:two-component system response regulator HydG
MTRRVFGLRHFVAMVATKMPHLLWARCEDGHLFMASCKTINVLVVEDDFDNRAAIVRILQDAPYNTIEAEDAEDGLDRISKGNIDILISDLRLPGMDGIELLERAKVLLPDLEVVLMTGHATIEIAVEALKAGAYDFITKPVRKADLLRCIARAAEKQNLARENRELRTQLMANKPRVIHASQQMRDIVQLVEQVAPSTATVLIRGESGTGKEVIAEAIHAGSPRRNRPLIKVNCAALPDTLLESELFGYERGAFTGASSRKEGRFELANGGTLFLDEIGEIAPAVQVKLLRVLQDLRFERLGGTATIETDVRIIAATNKNLEREIAERRFREDLFYRLNVVDIHLPPLRDRKDDIPLLAIYFLKKYAEKNQKNIEAFSEKAMQTLVSCNWPGNVRELENAVERAIVLTNSRIVPLSVLPQAVPAFEQTPHSLTFKIGMPLRELERQAIEIALAHARGNKPMAARLLDVSARTIYRHLNSKEGEQESEGDAVAVNEGETTPVPQAKGKAAGAHG